MGECYLQTPNTCKATSLFFLFPVYHCSFWLCKFTFVLNENPIELQQEQKKEKKSNLTKSLILNNTTLLAKEEKKLKIDGYLNYSQAAILILGTRRQAG